MPFPTHGTSVVSAGCEGVSPSPFAEASTIGVESSSDGTRRVLAPPLTAFAAEPTNAEVAADKAPLAQARRRDFGRRLQLSKA